MAVYFYLRISTQEERGLQKFSRQESALKKYAEAHEFQYDEHNVYKEDKSGKDFDRPEWNKLEKILREGDTVVFKDISRFTREAENGYLKYMKLFNAGISLVFLDNVSISTDNMKRLLEIADTEEKTFLMRTLDEFRGFLVKILIVSELDRVEQERLTLQKRIKDGIDAAIEKNNGMPVSGRKKGAVDKLTKELEADICLYLNDRTIMQVELMKKHGISRNTLKKYIEIVKERKKK